MSLGFDLGMSLGDIKVYVGKPDSTQPPEFWAERALERIMNVADTAPPPIRDQAHAFKNQIKMVIVSTIRSAVIERQARDALLAERKKSFEVAQLIREDI